MTVQFVQEYRTHDKTEWGAGPWNDEPDKAVWVDEVTGLDCMVVRNRGGSLCGYVGLPADHPLHGMGYDSCNVADCEDWDCEHLGTRGLRVHGGLTYAASCQTGRPEDSGVCHVPQPGRADDVWWLGFDTAHYGDISPAYQRTYTLAGLDAGPGETYKTLAYVMAEVADLAVQCKAKS